MTALQLVRHGGPGGGDPALVLNPMEGTLVPIDAATDELAEVHDGLGELLSQAKEAQALVEGELLGRMDRRGKWTAQVGPWRVEAPSPAAGTVDYEAKPLRRALLALAREGLVDREAVDEAVGYADPVPPPLKVSKRGVDALKKLGGKVAAVIDAHRLPPPDPPPKRRVKITRKEDT